jgi:hypothetical protein
LLLVAGLRGTFFSASSTILPFQYRQQCREQKRLRDEQRNQGERVDRAAGRLVFRLPI